MGAKIRNHTKQKVPFLLVVGDNEMEAGMVAPRARDIENLEPMLTKDFIRFAKDSM
jgi:threonyl-tRNA synthetase